MKPHAEPRLVLAAQDIVGESLVYDDVRRALVWVDICGRRIHRLSLVDDRHDVWPTPEFPTSVGLRRDGGAVVGLLKQVALWDYGAEFDTLATLEPDLPGNRLNEGCVAPDGSFWVGTMQNNLTATGEPKEITAHTGAFWRVAPNGEILRLTPSEYGIANTLVWTRDGRLLAADTLANAIYQFDHRPEGLSERRVFSSGLQRGVPDGSAIDAEGFLWNCRVAGGSCLARYAPEGTLDRLIELPCSWPTSCAFGGPDFATLFVTSARLTLTPDHLAAHPQEGGLFAIELGVSGLPPNRFGWD